MEQLLLTPPVAFLVYFTFLGLLSMLVSRLTFQNPRKGPGATKPYACGEDNYNHSIQPDYSYFFQFAFFFTVAHVAAMIIALVPPAGISGLGIAFLYLAGIITGFAVVLRK